MQKLMAANWKMFKTTKEALETAEQLAASFKGAIPEGREVVIFPAFTSIQVTANALKSTAKVAVGAQNFFPDKEGAHTGEISLDMLKDAGATWVLTGHSERRHEIGESDSFVGKKTAYAMQNGFKVIACIGETLEQRESNALAATLEKQILKVIADIKPDFDVAGFCIAYEPVWAIGTGRVAGHKEVLEAHALVRALLKKYFSDKGSDMRILYGGSVKPDNTLDIIKLDNVDGVLVGGASLQANSFTKIVCA